MAEQQAKTPEQEKEEQEKAEREKRERLNRRINFYVMRHMWQVIRGRNASNRIYECLEISRERYTRAIKTGAIRCSASELDKWEQLTGISKKIFQGEDIFVWYDRNDVGKPKQDIDIAVSLDQWKRLFAWREHKELDGVVISDKEGTAIQKKIHRKMKDAVRMDRSTHHFFQLCYFLEKDKPAPLQEPDSRLKGIQQVLETLTFSLAEDCSINLLEDTLKLLKHKQSMVNGVLVYRREKAREENS